MLAACASTAACARTPPVVRRCAALAIQKRTRVLNQVPAPNISESHSEISTRVPVCIATTGGREGGREGGRDLPSAGHSAHAVHVRARLRHRLRTGVRAYGEARHVWSLLFVRCSLLFTRCSLLFARLWSGSAFATHFLRGHTVPPRSPPPLRGAVPNDTGIYIKKVQLVYKSRSS